MTQYNRTESATFQPSRPVVKPTPPLTLQYASHVQGGDGNSSPLGRGGRRPGWVLPRFLRDRRAAGTALTAALFTLMSLAGIAFASDHVWLVYQRDLLKVASDAASVAVTKAMKTLDPGLKKDAVTAALLPTAKRYILANIPEGSREQVEDTLEITLEPNSAYGTVYLTATAELGGAIFGTWLWDAVASETQVKSGTEQVASGGGLIELALALDITGSMRTTIVSSEGGVEKRIKRIKVVKDVAKEMVNMLAAGSDTLAVGIVPWHYRVKFDQATRTRWTDKGYAQYPLQQHYPNPDNENRSSESYTLPTTWPEPWKGCVDQRATSGQNPPGLTAVLPTVTPFNMGFYSPTPQNEYQNNRRDSSIAFSCYSNQDFCYDPDREHYNHPNSKGERPWRWSPQDNCHRDNEILPLTTDIDTVKSHLAALDADGGSTYSTLGLTWGHRLLAPTWRTVWSDDSEHPIDLSQHEHAMKALLLLTDGRDNFYEESTANSHFRTACTAAKKDGIAVFIVAILSAAEAHFGSIRSRIENCAGRREYDPGQYAFISEEATAEDLRNAFRQIGQQILRFRRIL